MQHVTIKSGSYRNQPVLNETFPLVKPYQEGNKGGFITVDQGADPHRTGPDCHAVAFGSADADQRGPVRASGV